MSPAGGGFFLAKLATERRTPPHSRRAKLLGIARSRARRNIFACSSFSAFLFTLQSREFAVSQVARPFSSLPRVTALPPPPPLAKNFLHSFPRNRETSRNRLFVIRNIAQRSKETRALTAARRSRTTVPMTYERH